MILTVTMNASIDKRYVVANATQGEVNRVKECEYTPGGKGLNVSKPAVAAKAQVVATGFVGGHAGQYIEEEIEKKGIKSAFFKVKGESRSCINIWDEEKHQQTEYLEPGFTVTEEDFHLFLDRFKDLVDDADVVTISGSLPKGLKNTSYQDMVGIVRKAEKPVILDTSDELLRLGIEASPTMVKPNIDEIRMLTGKACDTDRELIAAAKEIHNKGVALVVISLGSHGSIVVSEEGVYQAVVPKIDAVNTVGCGDTMTAGFAIGMERGFSVEEMLKFASSMSTAAALRPETGFFLEEDRQRIYQEIKISKLI